MGPPPDLSARPTSWPTSLSWPPGGYETTSGFLEMTQRSVTSASSSPQTSFRSTVFSSGPASSSTAGTLPAALGQALPIGAKAGIAIGVVVAVLCLAAVIFCFLRRMSRRRHPSPSPPEQDALPYGFGSKPELDGRGMAELEGVGTTQELPGDSTHPAELAGNPFQDPSSSAIEYERAESIRSQRLGVSGNGHVS